MKLLLMLATILMSTQGFAETNCELRVGESSGMQVVEFTTGNVIHSKMSLKESSADALMEEMINLQDMGVCTEKIPTKRCVLKFEKKPRPTGITLYRGDDRWNSWAVQSKKQAQDFVRSLKRAGFCS